MNSALSRFQDDFARLLQARPGEVSGALKGLADQPGFAIYRNTALKACIDALQANYPAVLRLVGEEWFRAAAALYARARPPRDTRLVLYGADFPDFLRDFEPAAELPYLCGVARLDRCWTEAHTAADATVLMPSAIAGLPLEQLGRLVLAPHPAARWAWFEAQPVYTLWRRNRNDSADSDKEDEDATPAWIGEGALLSRSAGIVHWSGLGAAGCAFLDACAAGCPLSVAAGQALERQPGTLLAPLMATLLETGAFCAALPCSPLDDARTVS